MGLEVNRVKYNESWKQVRLKEVCNRISDGTHFTPQYVTEGVPFISVKDINNNKVDFSKCKYITEETHQELIKRCYPEKDDILITKSGTIGRMALVPEQPSFSLFVSVALIKNKKDVLQSRFLKYCLENFLNSINISQDIKGGLLKNFHLEDIRETVVPLVPIAEQQRIVSKIEELFSEIDKGIEEIKTAQQQLKVYRQAVLKWGFEGRLTNDAVQDGELPKGWKNATVGDVCSSVEYGSATKSKASGKVPVLRMGNIQNGRFEWDDLVYTDDDEEINKYLLKKNDVLFNRTNSAELVGKTAIYKGEGPAIFAGYLIRINRIEELVDANYLTYFLNSQRARSYGIR
jgi:type I restriction enzyme, S subunit